MSPIHKHQLSTITNVFEDAENNQTLIFKNKCLKLEEELERLKCKFEEVIEENTYMKKELHNYKTK